MESTTAILKTKNLSIGYVDKIICKRLNLELHKNELVCLLGQNGVGKSTLLKTLSNLQSSLSGAIELNGKPILNYSREALSKKIGIVTTEKTGMPNMTVRELVSTGRFHATNWLGSLNNDDVELIENAISKCGINYIAEHKLSMLSDGQRQKTMIARVLAQDAEIIFLDEPTAHLDVVNRVEVMKLLADIKKEKCILISTHELPLSMQFADKLWLMNFNDSLIVGDPEALLNSEALSNTYYHDEFSIDFQTGQVIMKK